jgi:hypothetical protein
MSAATAPTTDRRGFALTSAKRGQHVVVSDGYVRFCSGPAGVVAIHGSPRWTGWAGEDITAGDQVIQRAAGGVYLL